jgi:polyhydroxyalkanoate synthesis regulator phasin
MEDIWRKAKHFGLGLWDFTKEKVEALVSDMVKRGELSEQEAPQAVAQILEKAKEEQDALTAKIKAMMVKMHADMDLARQADLEALEKRVADLERQLEGR